MTDLIIEKKNETYMILKGDQSTLQELQDVFTFYADGYKFHPKVREKIWDGKIRMLKLISRNVGELYIGLIQQVINFCKNRNYTYEIHSDLKYISSVDDKIFDSYIKELNLSSKGQSIDIRDYQLKGFSDIIKFKRQLILSPTSSGKSAIIYCATRYLLDKGLKGLIVVPNVGLIHQLYNDFDDYSSQISWDVSDNVHKIFSGQDKVSEKSCFISTWQSLYTIKDKSWFHKFDFVIVDEAHGVKATSLTGILENCINSEYRVGLTGTLDNIKANINTIIGLTGPVNKLITTKELIDRKQVSNLKIKCLVLKYDKEISKIVKQYRYQDEIKFLITNSKRNAFIKNLALSLDKNTIVLFNFVETHGKVIYEMIKNSKHLNNRNVYFIHGGVAGDEREKIRQIMETELDAIIVASYGTMSTGVSIKNLHNIISAISGKSRIRNLQSIGRILRLHESKEVATLYDIVDNLSVGKHQNFTLNHFLERVKTYDSEQFEYSIKTIPFEN
jgi:superfamily II DNA or RNA helicase